MKLSRKGLFIRKGHFGPFNFRIREEIMQNGYTEWPSRKKLLVRNAALFIGYVIMAAGAVLMLWCLFNWALGIFYNDGLPLDMKLLALITALTVVLASISGVLTIRYMWIQRGMAKIAEARKVRRVEAKSPDDGKTYH